jgi:hypothetical protein
MPRSRRSRSPRRVPSGYELNPATNRLRKVCPAGKMRSPRGGYCVNIPRSPRRRSSSPRRIPAGYELNPATNRLRKKCPVGKVRSPFGSYCVLRTNRRLRSSSRSPRRSRRSRRSRSPVRGSPKECCVCYENTNRGVQGCKHPVCKTCFKGMKRSGRTLACPMCRGNMRKIVKV